MNINEAEILVRARAWFDKQGVPDACPKENCLAVNKWKHGKVSEVLKFRLNKGEKRGKKITDEPTRYAVTLYCDWCGHDFATYEEENGQSVK